MVNEKKSEVCIIGAGIGGLTAGALLTKQGYKVTIFEKESLIGGRALSYGDLSLVTLKKYKEKGEDNETLKKLLDKVVKDEEIIDIAEEAGNHKTVFRTDKLSKLNKHERKLLSRVFSIIKQVLTPDLAENLIKKIEEDFK